MTFLFNNCVFNYKLPYKAKSVDYSSELDLYAAISDENIYVWSPNSNRIVAEYEVHWEEIEDILFLPGNFIAVSEVGEDNLGYRHEIRIFSLNEETAVLTIDEDDLIDHQEQEPGCLTLTPDKHLLVSGTFEPLVTKIQIDLENTTFLGDKEIWFYEAAEDTGIASLCCSNNYTICCSPWDGDCFSCVDVSFTEDGEVQLTNERTITYCMINGEKRTFGKVCCVEHDGENVLVATDKDIIVMESATEGSTAHVVVSCGIKPNEGKIRLTDNNQLMVCEGDDFIKVYDYKKPDCLQGLCRYHINNSLKQHDQKRASVDKLPIPESLKQYLLYKT